MPGLPLLLRLIGGAVEPAGFTGSTPASEPLPVPVPAPVEAIPSGRVRASIPGGFGLESANGRHGLALTGLGQVRYAVDEHGGDLDQRFSLRLARLLLQGHFWGRRLTFQLLPEFAGGVRLLDAVAAINLHPALSLLVGQQRPWTTRAFVTNLPFLAQLDRGLVLDTFRIDRDVGLTVAGRPFGGRLEYYVGLFNGEGLDRAAPRNPQPLVTARMVAAPLGEVPYDQTLAAVADGDLPWRFAVAANAATNEISRVGTMPDPVTGEEVTVSLPRLRTTVVGGDVAVYGWRLMAMGEGFWRDARVRGVGRDDAWGAYGMVAITVLRKRLDAVARAGALRVEGETAARIPLEPGVNLYLVGNHAKLQLRYLCDLGAVDGVCRSQGVHLQGQLWF